MKPERTHSTYQEKTLVWAHYGYALMKCQVLEHRLADILFMCEMLNGSRSWVDQENIVPRYQKMTLGWLCNRISERVRLPEPLRAKLQEACGIRNELAHRYFKPRMDLLHSRDGHKKLIAELEGMYGLIEDVVRVFHKINELRGAPLGFSIDAIDRVHHDFVKYFETLPEAKKREIEGWARSREMGREHPG